MLGVKVFVFPAPPLPLPTGSNRRRDYRNVRIKKPDYKVAYVQLVSAHPDRGPERGVGMILGPQAGTQF